MNYYKKQLSHKEITFYQLLQNNPNFTFILFPEKVEEDLGYFRLLSDGNLLHKGKEFFLLATEAVAKFHHFSRTVNFDFIPKNQGYYKESFQNIKNHASQNNISLPEKQIEELIEWLGKINENEYVIHDDFLPQNIMVEGNGIKIIDWAYMRYGFPEHDIGRFLGDIEAKNPDWQKKYYPTSWKNELIQRYLDVRKLLDTSYDVQKGKRWIRLGEMWNYLGPIEMCLKEGDSKSEWFQENIKALSNT